MIVPYSVFLESAIIGFAIIIIFGGALGFLFIPKLHRLHILNDKTIYKVESMKVSKTTDFGMTVNNSSSFNSVVDPEKPKKGSSNGSGKGNK